MTLRGISRSGHGHCCLLRPRCRLLWLFYKLEMLHVSFFTPESISAVCRLGIPFVKWYILWVPDRIEQFWTTETTADIRHLCFVHFPYFTGIFLCTRCERLYVLLLISCVSTAHSRNQQYILQCFLLITRSHVINGIMQRNWMKDFWCEFSWRIVPALLTHTEQNNPFRHLHTHTRNIVAHKLAEHLLVLLPIVICPWRFIDWLIAFL